MPVWIAFGVAMMALTAKMVVGGEGSPAAQPAAMAPAFQLKDLNGADVRLSAYKGKAVVVTFWASWDEPSCKQMAVLAELQKKWREKQVVMLGLSLDKFKVTSGVTNQTTEVTLKAFAVDNSITFPILYASSEVINGFGGLKFLPTTYLLDPHHVVVAKHEGLVGREALEADLKSVIGPLPEIEPTVANP